ncbi:hypothetical protein Sme01_22170 [Sphaerisporangium melleum]|uniref:Uncharacterized protein n=1 Tax=Sphaerisporangium melleum TaxID=321316 RepID=A0A917QZQ9_9ACTN|nr:hypothetical protein [Sphaerisporangium melleum]GGK79132.1 hypothetical protein GCM10007964_22200 [Sphaerisporangium melleum]GII69741.1 hypothetical protein Sme01_22170 [Sphaerisporangium melleum]
MTRLHDALGALAQEAPPVNLAERAIGTARRRRARMLASAAAAVLLVGGGGATTLNLYAANGRDSQAAIGGEAANARPEAAAPLPGRGIGPARFAYLGWCGHDRAPGFGASTLGTECAQWRLITKDGKEYRLPEAVGIFVEQTSQNRGNNAAPLAISQDGRRVAYYSEKDRAFKVRDLAGGRVWRLPLNVSRDYLMKWGGAVRLSPDGRYAAASSGPDDPGVLFDASDGTSRPIPAGWWPGNITWSGSLLLTSGDQMRIMSIAGVGRPVEVPVEHARSGTLSVDDRTVVAFTVREAEKRRSGPNSNARPVGVAVRTIDAETGRVLSSVPLRGAPEHLLPPLGPAIKSGEDELLVGQMRQKIRANGVHAPADLVVYLVNLRTGKVHENSRYSFRGDNAVTVLPGMGGI